MIKQQILVRVPNWLGDLMMANSALVRLRQAYPEAHLVWLSRNSLRGIQEASPHLCDEWITFDDKGKDASFQSLYAMGRSLRSRPWQAAFSFTSYFRGAYLTYATQAPLRAGFASFPLTWAYHHALKRDTIKEPDLHHTLWYHRLLDLAGLPARQGTLQPQLHVSEVFLNQTNDRWLKGLRRPFLAIHAGAAFGTAKRWPSRSFAQLINSFLQMTSGSAFLFGVPSEAETSQAIIETMSTLKPFQPSLIDLTGKTTLMETTALLAQMDGLVSNDSGIAHVMSAFGKPQVTIFGPTHAKATHPQNPNQRSLQHQVPCGPCHQRHCHLQHQCMTAVTPQQAFEALQSLLGVRV
jgi:heptosyltransferase-2